MDAEKFLMKACSISFVLLESIIRIGYCKAFHQSISAHFREYGSSLDFRNEGVPPDNVFYFFLFNGIKPVIIPSVYFYELKIASHLGEYLTKGFLHSQAVRFPDSHLVDNLGTDNPHSSETGSLFHRFLDHQKNLPPLFGREFLGIVEQGREGVFYTFFQGTGSGDDRPGPRTTPRFIDSEEKERLHIFTNS